MTTQDSVKILALLKVAYPNAYKGMTEADAKAFAKLWAEIFADLRYELVYHAALELLKTSRQFPPSPGEVMAHITAMQTVQEESDVDLWNLLVGTIRKYGSYSAAKAMDAMPPILQRYVGSTGDFTRLCMLGSDELHTVAKGQFLKQIRVERERERVIANTPPEILALANAAVKRLELPEAKPMEVKPDTVREAVPMPTSTRVALKQLTAGQSPYVPDDMDFERRRNETLRKLAR